MDALQRTQRKLQEWYESPAGRKAAARARGENVPPAAKKQRAPYTIPPHRAPEGSFSRVVFNRPPLQFTKLTPVPPSSYRALLTESLRRGANRGEVVAQLHVAGASDHDIIAAFAHEGIVLPSV